MTMRIILLYLFVMIQIISANDGVIKYSSQIPKGMNRADLYYQPFSTPPKVILILCPGVNGNGKKLLYSEKWKEFALQHDLGLVAISFASSYDDIREQKSYYRADLHSGEIVKNAIKYIYGNNVKLLLYGFSGGAHFVSKFADTYPDNIIAWVAYSAMWKDKPNSSITNSHGLVICGENDIRLGASLTYFQQGRALKKPWLWLCIPKNNHHPDKKGENFIRLFFKEFIKHKVISLKNKGLYVDINDKTLVNKEFYYKSLTSTAWLINKAVYIEWRKFYE